jgi:predicted O-methyltransferase YrrM
VSQNTLPDYHDIQLQLGLLQGIPYTPKWSADADFIQIIIDACLEMKPSLVLECGSGLTTLFMARCCQLNGHGKVISLEDGQAFAEKTWQYIEQYALQDYVLLIHTPLQLGVYDGTEYNWYKADEIPDGEIDLLVIDGPSGFCAKHARYPALPVCYPYLARDSRVFLDDAARPEEREIVAMWLANYPDLTHQFEETSRGCSLFTVEKNIEHPG